MTGPERRQTSRTTVEGFAYINIEPNNGGSVLNVSEGGLCFHSIAPVPRNGPIRFWFSKNNRRIEATAELVWASETQKTGGLRFTSLSTEAREHIRTWKSQSSGLPAGEVITAAAVASGQAFSTAGSAAAAVQTAPRVTPTAGLKIRIPYPLGGFSRGLLTGVLLSALVTAGFWFHAYHQEIGELLIRLGERFAGKSTAHVPQVEGSQATALQSATPAVTAQPQKVVVASKTAVASTAKTDPSPRPDKVDAANTKPPEQNAKLPIAEPKTTQPATSTAREASPPPVVRSESLASRPVPQPAEPQQPYVESAALTTTAPASVDAPKLLASTGTRTTPSLPETVSPLPAPPAASGVSDKATSGAQPAKQDTQVEEAGKSSAETTPEKFFEIGRFRDISQANRTTEKLAQLGFPATAVQKGHLWKSSYNVLVGPYGDDDRAETAHKHLMSSGFKPRPFEKGSKNLSFRSKLSLNGAHIAPGDCTVSWESYITDSVVKFVQDNYLVVTANGKWIKGDVKYKRDAFVYRKNPDGSRTLVEIQFAGLNKALVFGKTS